MLNCSVSDEGDEWIKYKLENNGIKLILTL